LINHYGERSYGVALVLLLSIFSFNVSVPEHLVDATEEDLAGMQETVDNFYTAYIPQPVAEDQSGKVFSLLTR
jgi:hypothetical protein